jgi:hypothetical protein
VTDARSCSNCGAASRGPTARFCEYCGAGLPRPEAPPPPSPFGDVPARFAALREHADYQAALAETPSDTAQVLKLGGGIAFLLIFVMIAGFMSVIFLSVCPPLGLVPVGILIVGVIGLVQHMAKASRFSSAELSRVPALVVDERTTISGGGDSPSRTQEHVTLEFEDGRRQEYDATGKLAGLVTAGDMGVAFLRADVLLEFRRIRV